MILISWKVCSKHLRSLGIEKINIAGGEPLLYKKLNTLLEMAKRMGFTVGIVTNASLLNEKNIQEMAKYVDWVGISIDSADERIEQEIGRGYGKHVEHARDVSKLVHKYGMKLKINTTVIKLNYSEQFRSIRVIKAGKILRYSAKKSTLPHSCRPCFHRIPDVSPDTWPAGCTSAVEPRRTGYILFAFSVFKLRWHETVRVAA
jgi:wyosine [tRNA(Phe)-imidazoG37] synthetase (radical SAM superfamily)